jgi:hypothetical protein
MYGQDLTGIWRGSFNGQQTKMMEQLGIEDRYKFEIQLNQTGKAFKGVTYSYKSTIFYGKASCNGTISTKTKNVILDEMELLELKMGTGSDACIMSCRLHYSRTGDEEYLQGTYTSINTRDSSNCGSGTIYLRRVITSDFYKEPFLIAKEKKQPAAKPRSRAPLAKTTTPAKPPVAKPSTAPAKKPSTTPPANATVKKPVTKPPVKKTTPPVKTAPKTTAPKKTDEPELVQKPTDATVAPPADKKPVVIPRILSTRVNELVKTIGASGEITINIYDNGSIDNDTVSVYLDKKLVLSKKRLTDKPLSLKFNLDETTDFHELVMVAENLGEIPPNTSLMVVNAGGKKYEVRITSTEQKNAVVVFRFQKDE